MLLVFSIYPFYSIAMSLEMATLSTKGPEHPIRHPLGPDGLAIVSFAYLAVRFGFHEESIYVEKEVLKDDGNVEYTISQLSSLVTGQKTWSLEKGTYKVFGLSQMQMQASLLEKTALIVPKNNKKLNFFFVKKVVLISAVLNKKLPILNRKMIALNKDYDNFQQNSDFQSHFFDHS